MFKWKLHLSTGKTEFVLSDIKDHTEMKRHLLQPSVTFKKMQIDLNPYVDRALFNSEMITLKTHSIIGFENLID